MRIILCLSLFYLGLFNLSATVKTIDSYLADLDEKEKNELTTEKVYLDLVGEALKVYPDNVELYIKKAQYLTNKEKYSDAIKVYQMALKKPTADSVMIWFYLSYLYGYVGDYKQALDYTKKLEKSYAFDKNIAYLLLWNYYKNFLLDEAISNGEKFLSMFPDSSEIYSVMALLYMELYKYDKAKNYFNSAIELALNDGRTDIASSNYYNMYLLEMQYLNYKDAEDNLIQAMNLSANSDTYLIMGILKSEQLKYNEALEAFKTSQSIDLQDSQNGVGERSPNPHIEQVKLELVFNKFESAFNLLNEIEQFSSVSWMSKYSTYPDLHKANLYVLYNDYYESKTDFLKAKVCSNAKDYFENQIKIITSSFYALYYKARYRVYAIKTAKLYAKAGNKISSYSQYIRALDDYNFAKEKVIKKSMDFEISLVPKSVYHYQAMLAKIKKDKKTLLDCFEKVDPIYEKKLKVNILCSLIKLSKKMEKENYIKTLYDLHPSSAYIYKLPIDLSINDRRESKERFSKNKFNRLLKKAFIVKNKKTVEPYSLNVIITDSSVSYILYYDGNVIKEASTNLSSKTIEIAVVNLIEQKIYNL